jgi:hypothetical protein
LFRKLASFVLFVRMMKLNTDQLPGAVRHYS